MRIRVRLPKVEPGEYNLPKECPYEGCDDSQYGRIAQFEDGVEQLVHFCFTPLSPFHLIEQKRNIFKG